MTYRNFIASSITRFDTAPFHPLLLSCITYPSVPSSPILNGTNLVMRQNVSRQPSACPVSWHATPGETRYQYAFPSRLTPDFLIPLPIHCNNNANPNGTPRRNASNFKLCISELIMKLKAHFLQQRAAIMHRTGAPVIGSTLSNSNHLVLDESMGKIVSNGSTLTTFLHQ